jgi:hypothetical protein
MSGTSWNSVGKKHEEQRSSEGSGILAMGLVWKRFLKNPVTAARFALTAESRAKRHEAEWASFRRSKKV